MGTNYLTARSRGRHEKLSSLASPDVPRNLWNPPSQQPTTYPFPEPEQYSPHPLKLFLLEMGR